MPSISDTIIEIEKIFSIFNQKYFDNSLIQPVFITSSSKKCFGWCTTEKIWEKIDDSEAKYFELCITSEHLGNGFEAICTTLLHELVHLYNAQRGVKDCSRGGYFHNKKFKIAAEAHGLEPIHTEKNGWAATKLKEETKDFIKTLDSSGFDVFRNTFGAQSSQNLPKPQKPKLPQPKPRHYECPSCGATVYADDKVDITCTLCETPFKEILQK